MTSNSSLALAPVIRLVDQWRLAAAEWKRAEGTIPGAGFNAACFETCADDLAAALRVLGGAPTSLPSDRVKDHEEGLCNCIFCAR